MRNIVNKNACLGLARICLIWSKPVACRSILLNDDLLDALDSLRRFTYLRSLKQMPKLNRILNISSVLEMENNIRCLRNGK